MQSSGAPPSFEQLFEAAMPRAWSLALHLTGSREDAEDVMQDAALQALKIFDRFEAGTNFGAWFCSILVNTYRNRLQQKARRPATVSLDSVATEAEQSNEDACERFLYERTQELGWHRKGDPVEMLLARLDSTIIREAFGMLPVEFRAPCLMFWIEELSYEEIAQMLGVPLGTVRSRLHRGRKLLQKSLWALACERGLIDATKTKPSGTFGGVANLLLLCLCFSRIR